jgi:hypothetical protein
VRIRRSYDLFAVLAGMGHRYESVVTPIASPRGLPPDVSEGVSIAAAEYGRDGHSHSYLTFEELLEAQRSYGDIDVHQVHYLPSDAAVPLGQRLLHIEDHVAVVEDVAPSKVGPNLELASFIAYLHVYEAHSYRTRMTFWFDN